MEFLLISAGILLLSISFFIITYSLIWVFNSLKSGNTGVENEYQVRTTPEELNMEDLEGLFENDSTRRFDKRMDDLKRELAEANIPVHLDDNEIVQSSRRLPGELYNIPHNEIDSYIIQKEIFKDEVSD